jgi:hypothetical protein
MVRAGPRGKVALGCPALTEELTSPTRVARSLGSEIREPAECAISSSSFSRRKKAPGATSRREGISLNGEADYLMEGVGVTESMVVVVVAVDVVVSGVPEGAGASCVVTVSVVVDVSFCLQPTDSPRIPTASREPSKNFFMMRPVRPSCTGTRRSS